MDGATGQLAPVDTQAAPRRPRWLLFDDGWYAERHDVADPRAFYRDAGCPAFADAPSSLFDEQWYCARHADVRAAIAAGRYASGFEHYCAIGHQDHSPNPLFDEGFYRRANPALFRPGGEIEAAGHANGYDHYLSEGGHQGRRPGRFFDELVWRLFQPAGAALAVAGRTPLEQCLVEGDARTSWYFDPQWYLDRYDGVRRAIAAGHWASALAHYLGNWTPTRFDPNPAFSEDFYAAAYPDVARAVRSGSYRNGYDHFLRHGAAEGRNPAPGIVLADLADARARIEIEGGLYPDLFAFHIASRLGADGSAAHDRLPPGEAQAKLLFVTQTGVAAASLRHPLDFTRPSDRVAAVSVIMVLHNQFAFTLAALASLQAQGADIELILVDSGSSDQTTRIERHVRGALTLRLPSNLGFIAGCNAALPHVTGETILYLNNDVVLGRGAVAAGLRRLASRPDAGAVGGRIVRLHGRLQEAGCVIWRDGRATGYLRDRSADAPEANFVREVDFCSGVFLLVRTELARDLGGFDPIFAPAYFEDADFCIRLRERGHVVLYDPDILVTHYEYGSSAAGWATARMQTARAIFADRHRGFLRFQPMFRGSDDALARSSRRGQRRILFIEDRLPRRRLGSGYVRSNDIIRTMVALDFAVTVFPMHREPSPPADPREDFPDAVEVMHDRDAGALAGFLAERTGFFDLLWIGRTHNLRALLPVLDTASRDIARLQLVLDTEAVVAPRELAQRAIAGQASTDPRAELRRALEQELDCARVVQRIVAVSEGDAAHVRRAGHTPVDVLGHLAPPRPTARGFADRRGLLFVGALHAEDAPNFDSLAWFVRDVLPLLAASLPEEAVFTIAGHVADGVDLARFAAIPGLRLLGEVDDLTELYDRHRVFVAPTRYAGGIPFKVHEAASAGLPVVATSILCAQLGWTDGVEILDGGAANPARFVRQVVRLHQDPALWRSLREASLARLAAENSEVRFQAALAGILEPVLTCA